MSTRVTVEFAAENEEAHHLREDLVRKLFVDELDDARVTVQLVDDPAGLRLVP